MKYKLIIIAVIFAAACSSVQKVYQQSDYGKDPLKMIKRIYILTKNETSDESKSMAFLLISADMVKSNTNYIIKGTGSSNNDSPASLCAGFEGVAVFTLIKSELNSDQRIRVKGELYKCPDKILIWEAFAEADLGVSGDKKLENMSLMYEEKLNKIDGKAGRYAPAMFSVLYDVIKTIPNPVLTEDEVNEKIETETSDSTFFNYLINLPERTSS
jgi:probable lipoprotein (TIGR04455 family)